jgi:hypothetical protein
LSSNLSCRDRGFGLRRQLARLCGDRRFHALNEFGFLAESAALMLDASAASFSSSARAAAASRSVRLASSAVSISATARSSFRFEIGAPSCQRRYPVRESPGGLCFELELSCCKRQLRFPAGAPPLSRRALPQLPARERPSVPQVALPNRVSSQGVALRVRRAGSPAEERRQARCHGVQLPVPQHQQRQRMPPRW